MPKGIYKHRPHTKERKKNIGKAMIGNKNSIHMSLVEKKRIKNLINLFSRAIIKIYGKDIKF